MSSTPTTDSIISDGAHEDAVRALDDLEHYMASASRLANLARQLETELATQASSKWIPVAERLPEPKTWVLAYMDPFIYMTQLVYDHVPDIGDPSWLADGEDDSIEPTHWQPLPAPPKKEQP